MISTVKTPKFVAKEWNAGGAFHFYGAKKRRSYIIEVYTRDKVDGKILQEALDKALIRLPYYKQTFVRKKGNYYYADNDLPVLVAESKEPRVIGDATTNYHTFDITYYDKKISFAMFHGLCDGLGFNRLIESVLYYYFCIKDGKEYSSEGIYTIDTPYDESETADGFVEKTDTDPKKLKEINYKETRYRLPECKQEEKEGDPTYRLPLKIKTEDLLSWVKANNTTPACALATIVSKVIIEENDVNEGVVMGVLPASLRKTLHVEKTFKNASAAVFLPVAYNAFDNETIAEVAARQRLSLKEQLTEEYTKLLASSINLIAHIGVKIPFYFLKNKIMSLSENRPQDTFTLDYVGSLRTNDYSDQIEEVRYLSPNPYKGVGLLMINISETAGYFHISFLQTYADDRYYVGFLKELNALNIPYTPLPYDTFLCPEVYLPKEQR